jgi:hypothetical protein
MPSHLRSALKLVGHGGLEPPTSAVLGPERFTTHRSALNEGFGVIRLGHILTKDDLGYWETLEATECLARLLPWR